MLLIVAGNAHAADKDAVPPCPNDGYISDRMVPTARVAKEIYTAVTRAIWPSNLKKFPIVIAVDKGDHWAMSQTNNLPPPKLPPPNPDVEVIITTAGGGQLGMEIDKCTGAISHAAGVR